MQDHPLRYALTNELHARPFPQLQAPGTVAYLALIPEPGSRDPEAERAHLLQLLDRFGAAHPPPGATHYSGSIGRHFLKWESHTEFTTFTILSEGRSDRPFDPADFDVFPKEWRDTAPGSTITSAQIRVEKGLDRARIEAVLEDWFVPESLAVAEVLGSAALVAGDFRIDSAGHMRFALFADERTGSQRVGRIVQRLCEIETYKTMAMLGLHAARAVGPDLNAASEELSRITAAINRPDGGHEEILGDLMATSARLEQLDTQTAYRFAATRAYEAIVNQRIAVLQEERFLGYQTFSEFMMRRFDPAMRTVASTATRIKEMSERARAAGELLRTQVEVARSAQNQDLLASMDRRAAMQLRLQKTVEGLSVVAISYYGVNLAGYLAYPIFKAAGLSKEIGLALLTLPVVALVWLLVSRIRARLDR